QFGVTMLRSPRRACVVLLLLAGCTGPAPVAELEGVVTAGGKPLPRIRVQFIPDAAKGTRGPVSAAVTDEQGRFRLLAAHMRPGAVVGWHTVLITEASSAAARTSRVPKQFWPVDTTPLLVEVKPAKQQMDF